MFVHIIFPPEESWHCLMKRCRQKGEAAKRLHSHIFHCNIGFSSFQIEDSQQTQDLSGLRDE